MHGTGSQMQPTTCIVVASTGRAIAANDVLRAQSNCWSTFSATYLLNLTIAASNTQLKQPTASQLT